MKIIVLLIQQWMLGDIARSRSRTPRSPLLRRKSNARDVYAEHASTNRHSYQVINSEPTSLMFTQPISDTEFSRRSTPSDQEWACRERCSGPGNRPVLRAVQPSGINRGGENQRRAGDVGATEEIARSTRYVGRVMTVWKGI